MFYKINGGEMTPGENSWFNQARHDLENMVKNLSHDIGDIKMHIEQLLLENKTLFWQGTFYDRTIKGWLVSAMLHAKEKIPPKNREDYLKFSEEIQKFLEEKANAEKKKYKKTLI